MGDAKFLFMSVEQRLLLLIFGRTTVQLLFGFGKLCQSFAYCGRVERKVNQKDKIGGGLKKMVD